MPITRIDNKLIYFAHIPKCGGTTVEKAFEKSGYDWCFHKGFWKEMGDRSYVRSMPTHIAAKHLDMLFGENFFDFSFAVVRHPLKRFLSAFNYNRLTGRIPWYNSIGGFITKLESSPDFFLYRFDNHFQPKVPKIEELSSKLENRVYELYSDDYKRFGYGRLLIN